MDYQRATKSAQKEQSKTPSSSLNQTSLDRGKTHPLLELQQTIGNQAVLNMLRSKNLQTDTTTQTFVEPRFGHDFSQIPIHSTQAAAPQTKLKVNLPGDAYEQEADQVAEQVMHMTDVEPPVSDEEDETKNSLMHKQSRESSARTTTESADVPPVVHDVLNSGEGQSLDSTTRAFMETRFGHDFSRVRVHADTRADDSARSVNALAFTVGQDVVFGRGQYAPGTDEGRKLLAHELTHVIQQGGGRKTLLSNTRAGQLPRFPEQAVKAFGSRHEMPVTSSLQSGVLLQRQAKPPMFERQKELEARGHSGLAELAGELLVIELKAEQMQPFFQGNEILQEQYKMLRGHIEYVTSLIMRAGQASKVDPDLLLAVEVGLHLAGMNANLLQVKQNALAAGVAGAVDSTIRQGLFYSWEGMRKLKADPSWPTREPDDVKKYLVSTEVFFEKALGMTRATFTMKTAVGAASVFSAAQSLSPGLPRIGNWMKGLRIQSAVLAFEGLPGGFATFKLVSSTGALVLTDAEVVALARAGVISATALNLYMTSHGGRGGEGGERGGGGKREGGGKQGGKRGRGGQEPEEGEEEGEGGRRSRISGQKPDLRQIRDVAREKGIDAKEFGNFVHREKQLYPEGDYTYEGLRQLADLFKKGEF